MSVTRTPKALPVTFISNADVNARVKRFEQTKRNILTAAMGKEETRAIWYSRRHIEEILHEMYYLNADGVRLYFGAYSATDENYANQLCVVFVPTYLNEGTDKHKDLITEDEDNFSSRPSSDEAYINEESFKSFNFGSLCQPDCGEMELAYPNDES